MRVADSSTACSPAVPLAGVTVSQFFLLQAAVSCTVLAAELPAGRLTDRIGYRSTIVLCEGGFLLARGLLLILLGVCARRALA